MRPLLYFFSLYLPHTHYSQHKMYIFTLIVAAVVYWTTVKKALFQFLLAIILFYAQAYSVVYSVNIDYVSLLLKPTIFIMTVCSCEYKNKNRIRSRMLHIEEKKTKLFNHTLIKQPNPQFEMVRMNKCEILFYSVFFFVIIFLNSQESMSEFHFQFFFQFSRWNCKISCYCNIFLDVTTHLRENTQEKK